MEQRIDDVLANLKFRLRGRKIGSFRIALIKLDSPCAQIKGVHQSRPTNIQLLLTK